MLSAVSKARKIWIVVSWFMIMLDGSIVNVTWYSGSPVSAMMRVRRTSSESRGRVDYHFQWLTRVPMRARFDARRGVFAFPALFPAKSGKSNTPLSSGTLSNVSVGQYLLLKCLSHH